VTLSPVPGFARWLNRALSEPDISIVTTQERAQLVGLTGNAWIGAKATEERLKVPMLTLAARYLLTAKTSNGRPVDPVARFHLGNGARLERINWPGDRSPRGLREAHGLMVNYRYELKDIEANHEAFANEGRIAASRAVRALLRSQERHAVTQLLLGAALDTSTARTLQLPKPNSATQDKRG